MHVAGAIHKRNSIERKKKKNKSEPDDFTECLLLLHNTKNIHEEFNLDASVDMSALWYNSWYVPHAHTPFAHATHRMSCVRAHHAVAVTLALRKAKPSQEVVVLPNHLP